MTIRDDEPTWMKIGKGQSLVALGFLEADILAIVWELKLATVRDVYETQLARRRIAYTTVAIVITKLAKKGLLSCDKIATAFLYSPAIPRQEVIAAVAPTATSSRARTWPARSARVACVWSWSSPREIDANVAA